MPCNNIYLSIWTHIWYVYLSCRKHYI